MRARLSKKARGGFTLIELLVVIAIIGVLMGMLIPAVQKARSAAARIKCMNNMKNIGLAVQNYHSAYKKFPYATRDRLPSDTADTWVTGFILIMPFLEQDAIAKRWDPAEPRNSTVDTDGDTFTNSQLQQMIVPTFVCPEMSPPTGPLQSVENRAYSSYLFNSGTPDAVLFQYASFYTVAEPKYDGAIVPVHFAHLPLYDDSTTPPTLRNNREVTTIDHIKDGTAYTYLLGETDFTPLGVPSTSYGSVWSYGYLYAWGTTFHPFNSHTPGVDITGAPATKYGQFRSEHPGGAHFAMCDGSVHYFDSGIDPTVYKAMSTRAGNELVNTNDYLK